MSSVYIQEPATTGKVLLKTTFGDMDIELWTRETPKACRNFIQLCMEGFYDGTMFHRVIKNFIAQGGDPTGTGSCGESIYGAPFKDEIHSRLRFTRRGLVACANGGKDDNGSQFFITLGPTEELQGKHTIFGKITGDTVYNVLKFNEVMVDQDDKPVYDIKIQKTVVLNNPFDDIVPRVKEKKDGEKPKTKKQERGVKNFKLLSFGDEAEEDEIETTFETRKFEGKSKSTHDVLNDPKLSSRTVSDELKEPSENDEEEEEIDIQKQLEDVRKKLKSGKSKEKVEKPKKVQEYDDELWAEENNEKKRKLEEIRNEIKKFKREARQEKQKRVEQEKIEEEKESEKSEVKMSYEKETEKYVSMKKTLPLKGRSREDFALEMMKKFSDKLRSAKYNSHSDETNEVEKSRTEPSEWLTHTMECGPKLVIAKDANTKSADWYELSDPRFILNQRRREADKIPVKEKKKKKD